MDAEYFPIYYSGKSQVIKYCGAVPPYVYRSILSQALIIKPVDLGDLSTFVVTSNQSYSLWISDLQSEEEQECLDGIVTSIDEVAHEKVVGLWALSSDFE